MFRAVATTCNAMLIDAVIGNPVPIKEPLGVMQKMNPYTTLKDEATLFAVSPEKSSFINDQILKRKQSGDKDHNSQRRDQLTRGLNILNDIIWLGKDEDPRTKRMFASPDVLMKIRLYGSRVAIQTMWLYTSFLGTGRLISAEALFKAGTKFLCEAVNCENVQNLVPGKDFIPAADMVKFGAEKMLNGLQEKLNEASSFELPKLGALIRKISGRT